MGSVPAVRAGLLFGPLNVDELVEAVFENADTRGLARPSRAQIQEELDSRVSAGYVSAMPTLVGPTQYASFPLGEAIQVAREYRG